MGVKKLGNKAQLNKWYYSFLLFMLALIFFTLVGYSVLSVDPPSGVFRDADAFEGWEYVDGDKVTTAFSVKEDLGNGKTSFTIFTAPQFIKEKNTLKHRTEAHSLKGYYKPVRLIDDVEFEMEYDDYNFTDALVKLKLKDGNSIYEGMSVPVKVDGVEVDTVLMTDGELEYEHMIHFPDGIFGVNWSFGFSSTTDTIKSVAGNESFNDSYIRNTPDPEKNFGADTVRLRTYGDAAPTRILGLVKMNLTEFIGSGKTIDALDFETKTQGGEGSPIIQFVNLKIYEWVEGIGISTPVVGNVSYNAPNDTFDDFNADDGSTWTYVGTDSQRASGFKTEYVGSILNSTEPPITANKWINHTFTASAVQENYDANGMLNFFMNITPVPEESTIAWAIYPVNSAGNEWLVHVTYSEDNTAPTVTLGDNATISEDASATIIDTNVTDTSGTNFIDTSDADGDALTNTIVSQTANYGGFYFTDNDVLYFIANVSNSSGEDTAILRMDDGTTTVDYDVNITVEFVNDAPTSVGELANVTQNEDFGSFEAVTKANLDGNWSDLADGETVPTTYEFITSTNSSTTCYFDGSNNWDCDSLVNQSGIDYYTFSLNDTNGSGVVYDWQITVSSVNDNPWWDLVTNGSVSITEDTANQNISIGYQAYFRDVEDDKNPFVIEAVSNTSDVACSITSGDILCSTTNNLTASFIVIMSAQDSGSTNITQPFEVSITAVNDAPWWNVTANNTYSYAEDSGVGFEIWDSGGLNNTFWDVENPQSPLNCTVSANDSNIVTNVTWDDGVRANSVANATGSFILTTNCSDVGWESALESFDVVINNVNDVPSVPKLNTPINMSNVSSLLFSWDNSTDIEGDNISYIFEILNTNFVTVYYNESVIETANTTQEDNISSIELPDGNYYWRVLANDSGNSSWSEVKYFTHDDTAPDIVIFSPEYNNDYADFFNLEMSIVDLFLGTAFYDVLDGNFQSLIGNTTFTVNTTVDVAVGNHYSLHVYANDSANNVNYTSVTEIGITTAQGVVAGGGGGGARQAVFEESLEDVFREGVREVMGLNDRFQIFIDDEYHDIVFIKIKSVDGVVVLQVYSDYYELEMKPGDVEFLDFDDDGSYDATIELISVDWDYNMAAIFVQDISVLSLGDVIEVDTFIDAVKEQIPTLEDLNEEITEDTVEFKTSPLYILYKSFIFIALGVILVFFGYDKKRNKLVFSGWLIALIAAFLTIFDNWRVTLAAIGWRLVRSAPYPTVIGGAALIIVSLGLYYIIKRVNLIGKKKRRIF